MAVASEATREAMCHRGHRVRTLLVPPLTNDGNEPVVSVYSCSCGKMASFLAGEYVSGDASFAAIFAAKLPVFVDGNKVRSS